MVRFCLEDRVHADSSGHFCKCVICLDCQETVVNTETYFLIFSCFRSFFQAIYACRQIQLYLCILLSCLMFVKECNTENNSRKVLAIPLHDNSNMSALDPAMRGSFGNNVLFSCVDVFSMISQLSKVNEWKKGERGK